MFILLDRTECVHQRCFHICHWASLNKPSDPSAQLDFLEQLPAYRNKLQRNPFSFQEVSQFPFIPFTIFFTFIFWQLSISDSLSLWSAKPDSTRAAPAKEKCHSAIGQKWQEMLPASSLQSASLQQTGRRANLSDPNLLSVSRDLLPDIRLQFIKFL